MAYLLVLFWKAWMHKFRDYLIQRTSVEYLMSEKDVQAWKSNRFMTQSGCTDQIFPVPYISKYKYTYKPTISVLISVKTA